jgi:hypothetical protein
MNKTVYKIINKLTNEEIIVECPSGIHDIFAIPDSYFLPHVNSYRNFSVRELWFNFTQFRLLPGFLVNGVFEPQSEIIEEEEE